MNSIGFVASEWFWAFSAIPLMIIAFVLYRYWQKKSIAKLGNPALVMDAIEKQSGWRRPFRQTLLLLTTVAFILALTRPGTGSGKIETKRQGLDIVVVLDISKSMLSEDVAPSRTEKSKQAVKNLIDLLAGDRLALVPYAGQAWVQMPLTSDYSAALMALDASDPYSMSAQGTDLQTALSLASEQMKPDDIHDHVILVMSDGEDHESGWEEAANEATKKGFHIFTVGYGTEKGGPIPWSKRMGQSDFVKDRSGEIVITRRNADMLRNLAANGNGVYYDGNRSGWQEQFLSDLKNLERNELESALIADRDEWFQAFVFAGLIFLTLYLGISERSRYFLTSKKAEQ